MNKTTRLAMFVLLAACTKLMGQAHPEFTRLAGVQAVAHDRFEFHLPSPIDFIVNPEPAAPPADDPSKYINLEDKAQDYVVESKQIHIEGYAGSFNPTVVRWRGNLLMAFRVRDVTFNDKIALVWLDEQFEVKGSPYILKVPSYKSELPSKQQDPRLIVIGETLHMVYSNVVKGKISPEVRRVFHTRVHFDGISFYADPPEGIFFFDGEKEQRWEKNWSPFEYNGELYLEYSMSPHKVLKPVFGTQSCETIAVSDQKLSWKWGALRGGTQTYLIDGEYLGFFHSSISMRTVHSLGKEIPHYVMGAYTFSATPPFDVLRMSPRPVIGRGFYTGPPYKTWKPLRVVFPCGYVFDDTYIWVVYGKQDHEIWVAKLDRRKLMDSLLPVDQVVRLHGK